jgi:hypothetical protein
MDPVIGAAAISAGASLLGGSSRNRAARRESRRQQRNFENFVQIRSRDARKAGISPLAALGASGQYPTAFSGSSGAEAFDAISRGATAVGGILERRQARQALAAQKAQVDKTRAETDNVRLQTANAYLEMAKRRLQMMERSAIAANTMRNLDQVDTFSELQGPYRRVPPARYPKHAILYDNRSEYKLRPHEEWIFNPEHNIPEAVEGVVPMLTYIWANFQDIMRKGLDAIPQSSANPYNPAPKPSEDIYGPATP